jgi:hypothetical protein
MFILMLAPTSRVHPADSVLHGGAEFTRPEVELMTDATLSAAKWMIFLVSGL